MTKRNTEGEVLMRPSQTSGRAGQLVPVWDLGVRAFHWVLVCSVLGSAVTGFIIGRTALGWHLIAGEAMIVALGWRGVWGLLGSRFARFASFAYRPHTVIHHLRELRDRKAVRHLGHNPLGAMMVFAFLGVLLGIALTGVIGLGGMLKQGPARAFLSYATGVQALQWHNLLAFLVLAMICLHLAGVAYESWRGRENLVAAMITGDKAGLVDAAPVARVRAHPLGALAIVLVVGTLGVSAVVQLSGRPAPLVPPAVTDPVFAEQCGACHVAFPGSLASAFSWADILQDLQHHFGADASLGPDQVATIRNWLATNSAEHWDTLPSHVLRTPAADGSLRITDTPGWRARHSAITLSTFAAKPIYRSSNCVACHADTASGMFAPQNIAIPPIEAPNSRAP